MRLPQPGENVLLLCKDCHHSFMGPCPDSYGFLLILQKKIKNPKCPKCGGKKIILNPAVKY